ncbi:type III pantothenate kinase [Helicobacter cappadocius]|uniref:Type III pantothenate kinase n=1 Tax=Helicobacter cappadocius TaxID=3063998 RepID=A0AA90TAA1_9HELI|nr:MULTISPECIES: type III pantothenate kinase [unclassified Helicobacter]MDO7253833.1 type III pantothenate kinase [Helicobacter sp. faydin-H75]MDP2539722.1 type III pantothenate kinase [Helicobacter sp. faydin-H76]
MILCDIGNTYIHFCDTYKIWKNLPDEINKKELSSDVYYISVNSINEKKLLKAHKNSYNIASIVNLDTPYVGLGIDRKAACLGVENGVIIDAGSAITVDVMDAGNHLGGIILPGLAAYTQAYRSISPALEKRINFGMDFDELPLNTQSAISYGAIKSVVLTIKEIVGDKKAYFTGGDGKFLAKFFEKAIYSEMLVFNGMQISIDKALKKHKEQK